MEKRIGDENERRRRIWRKRVGEERREERHVVVRDEESASAEAQNNFSVKVSKVSQSECVFRKVQALSKAGRAECIAI